MEKTKLIGYASAILGGLSFGTIPVFSATLRDLGASSFEQSVMRLFFGAIVGLVIILLFMPFQPKMVKQSMRFTGQRGYMLQGLILAIMIILYLSSIVLGTPAGEAALLIQVHPFVTLILGWILFREKITISKVVALVFALGGLILLVHPWDLDSFLSSAVGDALALLLGILYAGYIMTSRWNNKNIRGVTPIVSVSWILIWTLLIGLPFLFIMRLFNLPSIIIGFSFENIFIPKILLNGILLAVIGGLVPYGFIMMASRYLEASRASILLLSEPVGAMVLAYLFLHEAITLWYLLGGFAIICAVVITILAKSKEEIIITESLEKI
ncbi:MAG: DMT family transporter [Candidatus Heimdallarchaeota archaeon]|nr:DMT family transporter [Candidatus Heimdallarchaeota archaeon]